VKGHLWMIREFGLRRWLRYQRSRRSGLIIDYGKILTADERAVLEERMESVPWNREEAL
jgi:hypothetical protein